MVRVEVKQEEIESDRHQYLVHIIFEVLVKNKWKDTQTDTDNDILNNLKCSHSDSINEDGDDDTHCLDDTKQKIRSNGAWQLKKLLHMMNSTELWKVMNSKASMSLWEMLMINDAFIHAWRRCDFPLPIKTVEGRLYSSVQGRDLFFHQGCFRTQQST